MQVPPPPPHNGSLLTGSDGVIEETMEPPPHPQGWFDWFGAVFWVLPAERGCNGRGGGGREEGFSIGINHGNVMQSIEMSSYTFVL
jgi:hypothetical protein